VSYGCAWAIDVRMSFTDDCITATFYKLAYFIGHANSPHKLLTNRTFVLPSAQTVLF